MILASRIGTPWQIGHLCSRGSSTLALPASVPGLFLQSIPGLSFNRSGLTKHSGDLDKIDKVALPQTEVPSGPNVSGLPGPLELTDHGWRVSLTGLRDKNDIELSRT